MLPPVVCVRRADRYGEAEVYPISIREPMPAISIPLRPKDRDIVVELGEAMDRVYRAGNYRRLDYRIDPDPPLAGEDANWADERLGAAGLR